jgi:ornithine cyclodeaminase/alanine dehydrogenase-like protein (mu-crystallin family)
MTRRSNLGVGVLDVAFAYAVLSAALQHGNGERLQR